MSGRVAVVTDSTAYLDAEVRTRRGIDAVPLQVLVGGRVCAEGADISADEVAAALQRRAPVSTSQPSPQRFADAYSAAAAAGASGVVSIHLSSQMSGTVDAAWLAAREAELAVHVVDSGSIAMGLGFAVLAAADAAAAGASVTEVARVAESRADTTSTLFYVDTIEHLRRGGRLGAAATLVGTALMVKPLLHLEGGRVALLEKVRTASRALIRLQELAAERAGQERVEVAVQHLQNAERAEALADRLRARIPRLDGLTVSEVGPVIGAHVGSGMLAVVVARAGSSGHHPGVSGSPLGSGTDPSAGTVG